MHDAHFPHRNFVGYHTVYCGPQVQYFAYMHIAALPSSFSSLLGTLSFFQAFLGYAKCFFCYAKHFSAMLSSLLLRQAFFSYAGSFFALPSIFFPYWSLVSFAKHFSSMLSTSQLFRAFFFLATLSTYQLFQSFLFYAERYIGSSQHISDMLSIFFCSAKHFAAMLSTFQLFRAFFFYAKCFFFSVLRVFFCFAVYCAA